MKICKLTNGLLVSLLFISVAEADSKYPATDFQPKVVYQDTEYKHSGSSSSSSSSKSKASSGKKSSADPAYPAANFEPEVLFKDEGYSHKKDKVVAYSGKTGSSSEASSSTASEDSAQAESGDSSLDLIIGLALLGIAGFVFLYKKICPKERQRKLQKNQCLEKKQLNKQ